MFRKLFVHELRTSWRVPALMGLTAVLLSTVIRIVFAVIDGADSNLPTSVTVVLGLFTLLYGIFMIASNVMVFFYMPVRFYRHSYSNAGYFFHTLPVTKSAFLAAHILSGGVWLLAVLVLDLVCIAISTAGEFVLATIFRELWRLILELERIGLFSGALGVMTVFIILSLLIAPFVFMTQCCCAVSLGQRFRKHKVFGAVVWFYILSFLSGIASSLLFSFGLFPSIGIGAGYSTGLAIVSTVYSRSAMVSVIQFILLVLEGVLFWVICVRRMKYKLNLE